MAEHRDELRRQLMDAAQRMSATGPHDTPTMQSIRPRFVGRALVAAASIVVVALVALLVADTPAVAAEVFRIDRDGDQLVFEVVGEVDDPAEARKELQELGLDVQMVGRPAAPSLVGDIVSVSSETATAEVESDGSRIASFRLPASGGTSRITIDYGRPARPGEPYEATESVPNCARFVGQTVGRGLAANLARQYGPQVEWRMFGRSGLVSVEVEELGDAAEVLDVVPIAPGVVEIVVTDTGSEGSVAAPSGC